MLIGNSQLIRRSTGRDEALSGGIWGILPRITLTRTGCPFCYAIYWTYWTYMLPSARLQQSLQVHEHTEVWPSRKGGGPLHLWLVEWSFGLSSNCYFATVLAPELLDILWPITLEVINYTYNCGASLWMWNSSVSWPYLQF